MENSALLFEKRLELNRSKKNLFKVESFLITIENMEVEKTHDREVLLRVQNIHEIWEIWRKLF